MRPTAADEIGDDAESMATWAAGNEVNDVLLELEKIACGPPQSFEEDNRQRLGGSWKRSISSNQAWEGLIFFQSELYVPEY